MAKEKTQVDVELAKIKAEVELARIRSDLEIAKTRERERSATIRFGFIAISLVSVVGMIAWAAVRISDKPAWLSMGLAILATVGTPSVGFWSLKIWLDRRNTGEASADRNEKDGGTGES